MSDSPLVLLVGHCMPDSFGLTRMVKSAARGVVVKRVNSERALRARLDAASLLLVNRVLDGRFNEAGGVELIARLAASEAATAMMLVSNYSDAQAAAVEAGALPGFGKQALRAPETADRVRAALVQTPRV